MGNPVTGSMITADEQFQGASLRLQDAVARAKELGGASKTECTCEALAFNLERAAWAALELAQAWVFEQRLGIPRKETESFDLLVAQGLLEVDTARRYRQICEFRSLSARDPKRVDWDYISGDLSVELELLIQWDERVRSRDRGSL